MPFVDLTVAKRHLKIEAERTDLDPDVTDKLERCEAVIVDFLKLTDAEADALDARAQKIVGQAILLALGAAFLNREGFAAAADALILSQPVKDLLRRLRDPALA